MKLKNFLSVMLVMIAGVSSTQIVLAGCEEENSATPELYSFFGPGPDALKKAGNFDAGLASHKTYFTLVEGPKSAEVVLFERSQSDGRVNISKWEGSSAVELRKSIEGEIVSNRGVHCVGEQSKAIFKTFAGKNLKMEDNVEAPKTFSAAVRHAAQRHGNEFVRITAILMC